MNDVRTIEREVRSRTPLTHYSGRYECCAPCYTAASVAAVPRLSAPSREPQERYQSEVPVVCSSQQCALRSSAEPSSPASCKQVLPRGGTSGTDVVCA